MAMNKRVFPLRLDRDIYDQVMKQSELEKRSANKALEKVVESWLKQTEAERSDHARQNG